MEILVSQTGLSNESKALSTPGVRMTDEEDVMKLDAEGRACYRSWTTRASYLSQDRCEQLARRMHQPNTKNIQALKRLVRFLKGSPRCLIVCDRKVEQPVVDVFSDSDWAGCAKTRRSTSSSYVMLGGHLLASSARTHNAVVVAGMRMLDEVAAEAARTVNAQTQPAGLETEVDTMDVEPSKVAGHCVKRLAVVACEDGGPEGRPIRIDDCENTTLDGKTSGSGSEETGCSTGTRSQR